MLQILQLRFTDTGVCGRIVVGNTRILSVIGLEGGRMLHFIQQFPVTVDITGGMLYSVQDFSKKKKTSWT